MTAFLWAIIVVFSINLLSVILKEKPATAVGVAIINGGFIAWAIALLS